MTWLTPRPALLLGAALVLTGMATLAAPTAAAQSAAAPAASAAPTSPATGRTDAAETAGPRRRPMRRSAARPAVRTDSSTTRSTPRSAASAARLVSSSAAAERSAMLSSTLRLESHDWLGIPYRWGGTSRRGIDCSSFTQQFVRETMGIELPRATVGQQYEGVGVSRSELRPGDLVFFRRRGTRHVGVYLGDNEFIHASSSRGVTVSDLSEGYYQRHYWMARRILTEPSGLRPTPRSAARRDSSGVRG